MAGTTGFEPATSGLTGRRELQASPRPQGFTVQIMNRKWKYRDITAPHNLEFSAVDFDVGYALSVREKKPARATTTPRPSTP